MSGEVLIRISEGYTCHAEGSDFCSCFQVQDIEVVLTGCANRSPTIPARIFFAQGCEVLANTMDESAMS